MIEHRAVEHHRDAAVAIIDEGERRDSALPNEKRGAASASASHFRSNRRSSSAMTSHSPPFLSFRNRLLQWPPGNWPRKATASATVKTGGGGWVFGGTPRGAGRGENGA